VVEAGGDRHGHTSGNCDTSDLDIVRIVQGRDPGLKSLARGVDPGGAQWATTPSALATPMTDAAPLRYCPCASGFPCDNRTCHRDLVAAHAGRDNPTMQTASSVTVETLEAIAGAFNRHDLDAIMGFFADDCVLEMPRGTQPWGERFEGRDAVREALAGRFAGIPDVHYGDARHWLAGDFGVSEWTLTGTTTAGRQIAVRGCDHWTFRDGKVIRKDSYWKIVEP
jgi:ketosteroid isomerase-like protein